MKLKDIKIGIDKIEKPTDVNMYLDDMKGLTKEIMVLFGFDDNAYYTIAENIIRDSDNNGGEFSQTELFKKLKESKSAGFILVHNHPNGVCIPTEPDVIATKSVMKEAKKKGLIFIEHYTWTNGMLFGIISNSVNKGIYIKNEDIVHKE